MAADTRTPLDPEGRRLAEASALREEHDALRMERRGNRWAADEMRLRAAYLRGWIAMGVASE